MYKLHVHGVYKLHVVFTNCTGTARGIVDTGGFGHRVNSDSIRNGGAI